MIEEILNGRISLDKISGAEWLEMMGIIIGFFSDILESPLEGGGDLDPNRNPAMITMNGISIDISDVKTVKIISTHN